MKTFTFEITNWKEIIKSPVVISNAFWFDGFEWEIWLYPRGTGLHKFYYASFYLCVKHPHLQPLGWQKRIRFQVEVANRIDPNLSILKKASTVTSDVAASKDELVAREPYSLKLTSLGFEKLIRLKDINEEMGWLRSDCLTCFLHMQAEHEKPEVE